MSRSSPERPVPGSERTPLPGAHRVGDAYPKAPVEITVVRRRAEERPGAAADQADIDKVERFAHECGLAVTSVSPQARSVGLSCSWTSSAVTTVDTMLGQDGMRVPAWAARGVPRSPTC